MTQECALRIEYIPPSKSSRVIIWEMAPAPAPEIVDVMEGEFTELMDLVMSRYDVRYLFTPENSLRQGEPETIRRLAACLHAYLVELQDSHMVRAEPVEGSGVVKDGVDLTTAPIVQQVLNLRCRVILNNDLRTMGALRTAMDRMAATLVDRLDGIVETELDSIIDQLRAADFEAVFTTQVTVEPADESHRELARAIGEPRQ